MIKEIRQRYNQNFSDEKYSSLLDYLNSIFESKVPFRVCETPIFVPKYFGDMLFEACNYIIEHISQADFKQLTQKAIPQNLLVPNEDEKSLFLTFDFGVCNDGNGNLVPQLIELQGFPSLYAWEDVFTKAIKKHFEIPENFETYFNGFNSESYTHFLKECLLGKHQPENVILLEIEPHKQGTNVDFYATQMYTGIKPVCISTVIREGRQLYYTNDGVKTPIYRIYNRVIFDEFLKRTDLKCQFNLTEDVDVEWVGHPNWFFRISKYNLPFLKSKYVPETHFLSDFETLPTDLENWVLKPLFSFAGEGVVFHVTMQDIENVKDRTNYLLQRKVKYEPVIQAPDGLVKCEIRMMFLWKEGDPKPTPCINLVRMSRGDLIGVKFNKDKTWVGGSIAFFEK